MAEKQNLRWWQEEQAPVVFSPPVVPVVLVEKAPDLWDELEAEAQARAVAEAQGEQVVIPFDSRSHLHRLRKIFLFLIPFAMINCGMLALSSPTVALFIMCIVLAHLAFSYNFAARTISPQTKPAVVLSREGLEIHIIGHDIGLIRWDEISDIRTYNLWPYRYVGIVPKDTAALCERLGKKATLIRANDWCLRFLYRPLRVWCAPINIPQQNLPITADALLARIAAFEAGQG